MLLCKTALAAMAAFFLFCSGPAMAASQSAAITRAEWTAYLQQDAGLREADSRLNATYRAIINALGAEGKNALLLQQRTWIQERNNAAFARHAKGSPEYLKLLAEATFAREVALRSAYPAPAAPPAGQTDKPVIRPPKQADEPSVQPSRQMDKPAARPSEEADKPSSEPKIAPRAPVPDKSVPKVETASPRTVSPQTPEPPKQTTPKQPEDPKQMPRQVPESPKQATRQPAPPEQKTPPDDRRPENDLVTNVAPQVATKGVFINTTSAKFGTDYNVFARSFNAAQFPSKPSKVTGKAPQKTESYAITNNIRILFNYAGNIEKPETITFQGQRFVSGTPRDRDEIAYALVTLLKTLDPNPNKTEAEKNAEISGLLRGINTAFTKDATRIWRNNGLMYVISYVKQADLFSMTVRVDNAKK